MGRKHRTRHGCRHALLRRPAIHGQSIRRQVHVDMSCHPEAAPFFQVLLVVALRMHVEKLLIARARAMSCCQPDSMCCHVGPYMPPGAGLSGRQVARLIAEENTRRLLRLGNEMLR